LRAKGYKNQDKLAIG